MKRLPYSASLPLSYLPNTVTSLVQPLPTSTDTDKEQTKPHLQKKKSAENKQSPDSTAQSTEK